MSTFEDILARWPWLRELESCPQDPEWHQEGNVLVHTRMVSDAVCARDHSILMDAAVLHDVGKPATTKTESDGRITSKGHGRVGSIITRDKLYQEGYTFQDRELIAGLVRWHQVPFHAMGDPNGVFRARLAAETCSHQLLASLAEADATGRVCGSIVETMENISLYRLFGEEAGVGEGPFQFVSDAARLKYYQSRGEFRTDVWLPDPKGSRVTMMIGLPGSGKSRWLKENAPGLPVVSMDALRGELDVAPTDNQGTVVQAARERAREFLREKRDFAWDATNLSHTTREYLISLFMSYDARVRLVYLEVPLETLRVQNSDRKQVVPWAIIQKMMGRWELPTRTEAHEVLYVVRGSNKSDSKYQLVSLRA
jgi:predicted kinase